MGDVNAAGLSIKPQKQEFLSIQVLRGVAALSVVIFHSLMRFGTEVNALAAGVDIFFVISGFVMVASTDGKPLTPGTFLKRRLQRIVPLYWIALAATLVTIMVGVMDRPLPPPDEILKSFFFIFYTDSHSLKPLPFLGVGWTLNYEMLFYLLFAATMALGTLRQIFVLAVVFALAVAARKFIDPNNGFALRMTSPLPFEFLFGMCIAYFRPIILKVPTALLVIALTVGVAILIMDIQSARTITGGIPSAMIVAAAVGLERRLPWGAFKPALWIGNASYALYLFHGLVIDILLEFGPKVNIVVGTLFFTICSVISALLIYSFIEKPIMNFMRSISTAKRSSIGNENAATIS